MDESILEKLVMNTAEPVSTNVALEPIEVFREKSQDADIARDELIKLATEFAMGSTPVGGTIKAGKGVMSLLKGLIGKGKSKYKFPVGYGEPTKNIAKKKDFEDEMIDLLYDTSEASKASLLKNLRRDKTLDQQLFELKARGEMLTENAKRASKMIAKDQKAIDEAIKRMKSSDKPKGMRQFGKFNRQKWEI